MKRIEILVLSLALLAFSSCNPSTKDGDVPTLSVTNYPQKFFLEQIVGNKYKVNSVIPPGVNPEGMDLSPSQLIALTNSIAYFKIGFLEIENILVEKVETSNSDIKIFECSKGINVIKDASCQGHDELDGHYHGHVGGDPHTWSSIENARIIAKNMYEDVLTLDKVNESYYKSNYDKLLTKIDSVDNVIKLCLETSKSKTFIIYHPALSYFAREYNLVQYAIENEGKNPSPMQIKALIDKAKAESTKVVFMQKEFDVKNAETIAISIGAKTVPIDLLSHDWDKEMIKIARAIAGLNE